ncbi:biotin/lipoate--protein ligase family protein [Methylobacterium sp. WSM2598]|uniref:biotin/lipoate--protein ligase family protein n=1 Tax=Methylobacterium sp. WSM2598 TaxID=398261 RepID=UPI0003824D08|nr:biotin/lipoate--protein ligase family protein [Methylobacterium sp. WSM2598]
MSAAHSATPQPLATGLMLPPPFTLVTLDPPGSAQAEACRRAADADAAGTLILSAGERVIEAAVVLAPEEPLRLARRAALIGMGALADALGSHAPPDKPVAVEWPLTLRFDGARLGGGRLAWPEACGEDEVPDWLVFSCMLIASKRHAGDPGLTPDSTSLEEEGFAPETAGPIVESFAQYLMKGLSDLEEDGFAFALARYRAVLAEPPGERLTIDGHGDALAVGPEGTRPRPLGEALRAPAWLDPATGAPRL